jgi:hypothetical protein
MGLLRVELVSATGLPAADRSGKSDVNLSCTGERWIADPVVLAICGLHAGRSQSIQVRDEEEVSSKHGLFENVTYMHRTLSPVWDESFEVTIPSRVASHFRFEISDWDRVSSGEAAGVATY